MQSTADNVSYVCSTPPPMSPDRVGVVRLGRWVLERPEGAGLAERASGEELLWSVDGVGAADTEVAGELVGKFHRDVVDEPVDVLAAQLVDLPDVVVVEVLHVEHSQEPHQGEWVLLEPFGQYTHGTYVTSGELCDDLGHGGVGHVGGDTAVVGHDGLFLWFV